MLTHAGTQRIETERLILRKFEITDVQAMFKNWASDPENCKHMTWNAHKNVEETKNILSEWISNYSKNDYYQWAIVLKETDELVGCIGTGRIDEDTEKVPLGYVISKKHWGKGIMTEALKAVTNYLFEKANFSRIQAHHYTNNPASGRVMQKCGMKYEGILRKFEKNNRGELVDTCMYSILKEEWQNLDLKHLLWT